MYAEDKTSCNVAILSITVTVYQFALAIAQAVFTDLTKNLLEGCESVWWFVLIASAINFSCSICSLCGTYVFLDKDDFNKFKFLRGLWLGHCINGIYAIIIYHTISNSCKNLWESKEFSEWALVMIQYVQAWIAMVVICGFVIYGFCTIWRNCRNQI